MIKTILTILSIIGLGIFTYSYKMRQRLYNDYPTSCNVIYIPKKENIL